MRQIADSRCAFVCSPEDKREQLLGWFWYLWMELRLALVAEGGMVCSGGDRL